MRRIVALSVTAFLLAACSPEAPGGGEAAPPADAPAAAPEAGAEFKVDFSASGTEPFWRVDVSAKAMKVTQPDSPALVGAVFEGLSDGPSFTWSARSGETLMMLTVTKGDCSDGMSDLKYSYTAALVLGDRTLTGCGFPTAQQPREG